MNEKREMRSVPSTDSNKHERPGVARARYAVIGVSESAMNDRVTEVNRSGSSAVPITKPTQPYPYHSRWRRGFFGGPARRHGDKPANVQPASPTAAPARSQDFVGRIGAADEEQGSAAAEPVAFGFAEP